MAQIDDLSALHDQIRHEMAGRESELIELHRSLVRIPTVNRGDGSSAGEDQLAAFAAQYLKEKAGVGSTAPESAPGRANLLASTGNAKAGRSILWMSHADVVPTGDEASWTYPPFSAELAEGRIWGRGANDCKMLVAAQLFAMACLAKLGLPKGGELRLAVGADEEVGGRLGFGWLAENHADFLKADLAIGEGGGDCIGFFENGLPVFAIDVGEKGRADVVFTARGSGGHASTPWGKPNPLLTLTEVIRRIDLWEPSICLASPIFTRVANWASLRGQLTEANLPLAIQRLDGQRPGMGRSLMGQSRMTLTPTMLQAGDKANAIPTEARLTCDARLLPGQSEENLAHVVRELIAGLDGVDVHIDLTTGPSVSDFSPELEGLFQSAAQRAVGRPAGVAAVWCVGATDARYVRSVGTPVYGFQLEHPDADPERLTIHSIDESIEVRMLLPCALALAHFAADYFEAGRE